MGRAPLGALLMDSRQPLPIVARLDGSDTPGDVIDVLALGGFVAGTQPWARSARLQRVKPDARLLPPGVEPTRAAAENHATTYFAVGDGWSLRARRWRDRTAELTVTATSDELARHVLAQAVEGAVDARSRDDTTVPIGFWHRDVRRGASRVERTVSATRWRGIRRNYASTVAAALDRVMAVEPPTVSGRLVLLHGPPGTGKTTALRALAHAWHDWCRVDFVLDPDHLFGDVSYLMDVVLEDLDDEVRHDDDVDRGLGPDGGTGNDDGAFRDHGGNGANGGTGDDDGGVGDHGGNGETGDGALPRCTSARCPTTRRSPGWVAPTASAARVPRWPSCSPTAAMSTRSTSPSPTTPLGQYL